MPIQTKNRKPTAKPMLHEIQLDLRGNKIDLEKLHRLLMAKGQYKSNFDTDSNPYCNYVTLKFEGTARLFSNGKITTNLNFPQEALIDLFWALHKANIMECYK